MPDATAARDELVALLGRLPTHDLDAALSARLRERAHARLARTHRLGRLRPALTTLFDHVLEPALAGMLAAGNLAWAVLRSLELLT